MGSDGLERLEVWHKAKNFALAIYKEAIPKLPAEEKWGLAAQLRRAAVSIPANIAEGHGRFYYQDTIRFCYIARGSLEEVFSHLLLAQEIGFLPKELVLNLIDQGNSLSRLINGYIIYLKRARTGENEPGANYAVRESSPEYLVSEDLENNDEDLPFTPHPSPFTKSESEE